ncbi:MAG: chemotaxis protein CheA [Synergistales bacterium]
MDLKDYLGPFIDETEENLQKLNEALLSLEAGDTEVIDEIFRVAHTLKGMAATMGFNTMASLTHAMEDVFDAVRKGALRLRRREDASLLFRCLDTLTLQIGEIRGGRGDEGVETAELVGRLRGLLLPGDEAQAASGGTSRVTVTLRAECLLKGARAFMVMDELSAVGRVVATEPPGNTLLEGEFPGRVFDLSLETDLPSDRIREIVLAVSEVEGCEVAQDAEGAASGEDLSARLANEKAAEEAVSRHLKVGQTVRIDVQKMDCLLNLVGELVIGKSRIERLSRGGEHKEFEEPILQLGRITKEIQDLVTKLRMQPIGFIFDRFPRLVRDLSQELGKKVVLEMEGRDTELDRRVIEEIGEPMIHLIRNSLDHGIETPEERSLAGKPEIGLVRIRATQDGSSVVVAVDDDGRGVDRGKVLRKALDGGFLSPEKAETITDRELFQFLFLPGFSTSDEVTELSGRGVGMDAVKTKVESLGGRLTIESEPGRGSTVKIRLPITLAIVLALLVRIDRTIYAIPLESVDETLRVGGDEVKPVNGKLVTMLRDQVLPLVDARARYGLPECRQAGTRAVVVMRTGFRRIGFIVDDFIGQQEIVIKNFGNTGMTRIRWFSGGTILGDGSVALIIDPAAVEEGA